MAKNENKKTIVSIITLLVLIALTILVVALLNKNTRPEQHQHKYSEAIIVDEATDFECGKSKIVCEECQDEIIERIPATMDMPQIYFEGDFTDVARDNAISVGYEYLSSEDNFKGNASIRYQGHSTLKFEKKNYTIKLFVDDETGKKTEISLNGWDKSNKFCLKANYTDYSQSRNIVSANIWSSVVASRNNLDKHIAKLQHYGAIDGYPVMVFINDEYKGIYTMNIPKDDDTYKIGNDEGEALFVVNNDNSPSAHFEALITDNDKNDKNDIYDLEYCYGNEDWAYESFNNLISFVMNNDGEAFRKDLDQYLDVNSAIDYLICSYYLGVSANFNKNVVYSTYDGEKWILSMYDLDTACGLAFDGSKFFSVDYLLPTVANGKINSNTDNLLFEKLLKNYPNEIKQRYFELRKKELSNEIVIGKFKDFSNKIPAESYKKELEIWNGIPFPEKNNVTQIEDYINQRSKLLDEVIYKL